MTNKRASEVKLVREGKKMKFQEYVSRKNGSIHKIFLNRRLQCYLYEHESDLIGVDDVKYNSIESITGIDERYCIINYTAPRDSYVLDTINQKIFYLDPDKWNRQEGESNQYIFATNDLVINYVKERKPSDLMISLVKEDEKIVVLKKKSIAACVKVKKDVNLVQLC
uniref:Uncharacterized protein n=1 Tax=Pithovirus LCPAC403 TaxID=2506596 RepID=A0A481ZCD0_9VIRU|nr:MAG: uncharacterized protein LCPAC403_01260 [Pithovirus LCPAC403]